MDARNSGVSLCLTTVLSEFGELRSCHWLLQELMESLMTRIRAEGAAPVGTRIKCISVLQFVLSDAELSPLLEPYLEDCFVAALDAFRSDWYGSELSIRCLICPVQS